MKRLSIAIVLLLAWAAPSRAADEGVVLRAEAARLAADGKCDRALPLLERARTLAPDDARAALLQGECLLQGRRYVEAVLPLEDATRLDPDSAKAALYLGMAKYHAGDPAGADAALERAEKLAPDDAQVALYRGLALLDLARNDEAVESLNRASRIDPGNAEPIASYYTGLALQNAGRTEEARASLRRASELAPGSEWDRQAQAALAGAPTAGSRRLRRWLVLEGGLAYDSNVALVGSDVSTPDIISGKSDGRGEWSLEAGHELFRTENWGGGVMADYYGNAYFRDHDYDLAYVGASLWVDRRVTETGVARIQPMFGAVYYDYDDYLRFYGFRTDYLQDWGKAGSGDFWFRYAYNDFLYKIRPPRRGFRNRDGHDLWFGYDHSYPLTESTTLQGGPFGRYYDADGGEWDFWGVGGWAGVIQRFPWEVTGELDVGYEYDQYANTSSYPNPGANSSDRRDHIVTVSAALERPIVRNVVASLRWTYWHNDSNTGVFDYDRHVAGAYITVAFGD